MRIIKRNFIKKSSKRKSRSFFPQNYLRNNARFLKSLGGWFFLTSARAFKLAILIFLFLFLFLNVHSQVFPENEKFDQAKREVLRFPFDPRTHANLAQVYLEIGNLEAAEKEFSLAKSLAGILSADLRRVEETLESTKEKPKKIREEIDFWEKITEEKPDYRDAYLKLAVLNYQIGQNDETKKYLQKIFALDPHFEPAERLKKLLKD